MQTATDSDLQSAGLLPQAPEEQNLYVRLYLKPTQNEAKTLEAGRPIFEDREYVTIGVPGDKNNIWDGPVWNDPNHPRSHVNRFRQRYTTWKSGRDQSQLSGTPVDVLANVVPAILSRSQVEEFKALRIQTVEQIASMPDDIAQRFVGIQAVKQKIAAFLETSKSNAPMAHLQAELNKRDLELANMKRAIEELQALKTAPVPAPAEPVKVEAKSPFIRKATT